jgi:hypothetical protein
VKKVVISTDDESVLAAPTTWINTAVPYLPIANPSTRPWYIRTGEVVGQLLDLDSYADKPKDEEEWKKLAQAADAIKTTIGMLREQDLASATTGEERSEDDKLDGDEAWGPKTRAVPEDPLPDVDVSTLVNWGPDIPKVQRAPLEEVLRRNTATFGVGGRLGHVDTKVPISLKPDTQPISMPMYGASPAKREVIDAQMDKWFEAEVIEPSVSPWGFPCVVVYRNRKPRLVIDYWKLNERTVPDEFPIPRQSEILQTLSGTQVLSSFDTLTGFTQLEMAEDAKEKTVFRSHRRLWQFRRMPFRLRNGPSIFQRVMQGVLAPYLWLFTLVYIDDIVVFSKSWEEHLVHLDNVLGAIAKAGITLSPAKCFVGYSSILLLGQKVSRLGFPTHAEKVAAIIELERPMHVSDLQKFLGMCVYFSQYIPFYAYIITLLFELLKKGVKFVWSVEHEMVFWQAKDALAAAPILGHAIRGQPYRLYSDASDFAIGTSLQQVQLIAVRDLKGTAVYDRLRKAWDAGQDVPRLFVNLTNDVVEMREKDRWAAEFDDTMVHVEHVIAYWSRTLKPAEQNYSVTEREALGAKEGLVKYQPFIEGEQVALITDHAALQWARVYENANRRLAAWGAVFAAYPGLKIVHRPGRIHSNVDPLSRLPRIPPHSSPVLDDIPSIVPDESKQQRVQGVEDEDSRLVAKKAVFCAMW